MDYELAAQKLSRKEVSEMRDILRELYTVRVSEGFTENSWEREKLQDTLIDTGYRIEHYKLSGRFVCVLHKKDETAIIQHAEENRIPYLCAAYIALVREKAKGE